MMGSGCWNSDDFDLYAITERGMDAAELEHSDFSAQEYYRERCLHPTLSPVGVNRLCRDSEEHPNTVPVILALDVTGSMGNAAVRTATGLNSIMTGIYNCGTIKDIEFCVMAIGDIHYDSAPIQISQFESDIRIAEHMDRVWFEGRGGGNSYESYTAAWYMGLNHCDLDCWKRGKKGLIITLGDELPNPFLNAKELGSVTGESIQADIETPQLLEEVKQKFEVYHLSVNDSASSYKRNQSRYNLDHAWCELLGDEHYRIVTMDTLSEVITEIVKKHASEDTSTEPGPAVDNVSHFW